MAHPIRASLPALAAAVLAVMAIVGIISPGALSRAFAHHHLAWLLGSAVAELLSVVGYAVAYRTLVHRHGRLRLSAPAAVRMVLVGFGMFAVLGGFSLDRLGLSQMGADRDTADRSVLSLGVLEIAALAIAACLGSVILLATGSRVTGSMLWPWALAVPAGAALVLWLARRPRPLANRWLRDLERPLAAVKSALGQLLQAPAAWLGITMYFAADIASLGAGLRAVNVSVAPLALLIAYASGFIMTRRTLPIGGAAVVELLLTFSLSWVGAPLAGALAGVVVYRGFNLILIAGLGTAARHRLSEPARFVASDTREPSSGRPRSAAIDGHEQTRGHWCRRSPAAR